MTLGTRYAVLRVPNHGPKALIAAPNTFETRDEAQERVNAVLSGQLKLHHTVLEILPFDGDLYAVLERDGILY